MMSTILNDLELNLLPFNFMASDSIKHMTGKIIDEILNAKGNQEKVDKIYENLCSMIYNIF